MQADAEKVLVIAEDEPAVALKDAESAKAQAERSSDRKGQAIATIQVAQALSLTGKPQEALAAVTEAMDLCEDTRFDVGRAAALALTARIVAAHGGGEDDAELALESAEDALRFFRRAGIRRGEAVALWSMARVEAAFGGPQQVVRCARESIALLQELGESAAEAVVNHTLADGLVAGGDVKRATLAMERALAIYQTLADKKKQASCLHRIAQLEIQGSDPEKAVETMEKARGAFNAVKDYKGEAEVMGTERDMHLQEGRFAEAMRVAKETVTHYHKAGDTKLEGRSLLKVSELLLDNNDVDRAQKVAEVAMGVLSQASDPDGTKDAWEMMGAIKHARVKTEMQQVIELNSDFMHVPKTLVVDPGLNKRIQAAYNESTKKKLF
mmetsp:Transcript_34088/g.86246  ORF Transcript_34088/g.86246 Transcript_34088/m.86246 type:complete len:383 (+) Transcript_34088:98-1246(+)